MKKVPEVIFATPKLGVCYEYPENGGEEERPYISFDYIEEILLGRADYLRTSLDESKDDDSKESKILILFSALTEIDMLNKTICESITKKIDTEKENEEG